MNHLLAIAIGVLLGFIPMKVLEHYEAPVWISFGAGMLVMLIAVYLDNNYFNVN